MLAPPFSRDAERSASRQLPYHDAERRAPLRIHRGRWYFGSTASRDEFSASRLNMRSTYTTVPSSRSASSVKSPVSWPSLKWMV